MTIPPSINWKNRYSETAYAQGTPSLEEMEQLGIMAGRLSNYKYPKPDPTFDELVAEAQQMAIDHRYGIGYRWFTFDRTHQSHVILSKQDLIELIDTIEDKMRLEQLCPTVALPNGYQICL